MGYLLDSIVLIWAVRRLHSAHAVLARLRAGGDVALSAITHLELRRALDAEEFARVEADLDRFPALPVDAATARAAGDYLARCYVEGHRVDLFAAIIAITAARNGRTLVTYSPAHYPLDVCELLPLAGLLSATEEH